MVSCQGASEGPDALTPCRSMVVANSQQPGHLLRREAQVLEGRDAIEPGQLAGRTAATAGEAVHPGRFEQAHLGVIAGRFHRHLAGPGKVAGFEHAPISPRAAWGSGFLVTLGKIR